jgi:DUF1009 family protein
VTLNKLGLIAGNGSYPLEVALGARRRGIKTVAIAHLDETLPELPALCDETTWIKVGEVQKILDVLKHAEIKTAAMAGGVSRTRLRDSIAPDARAIAMLVKIGKNSDDAVLRGLAAEIEAEGIEVIDPIYLIDRALAEPGRMAGPDPTSAQLKDLALAFDVARALGKFDIGQAVAVRDGVVAAIEAVEGTDAALRRAALVQGKRIVVGKVAKPGQDLRFDRPAIGPRTIELLHEIDAAMIGVEAGTTMILERERTLELAESREITVFGYA